MKRMRLWLAWWLESLFITSKAKSESMFSMISRAGMSASFLHTHAFHAGSRMQSLVKVPYEL